MQITPLTPDHAPGLWEALGPDPDQWTYMSVGPCRDVSDIEAVVAGYLATPGWLPHALLTPDGAVLGVASYLRITAGSAEIGAINYSSALRRTVAATEAMTLLAAHVFASGYRRYEWKCDALNAASRAAALRLGFRYEGTWRNADVVKGRNRDTAWFAMTDDDWQRVRGVHLAWLAGAGPDGQAFRLSEAVAALWDEPEDERCDARPRTGRSR